MKVTIKYEYRPNLYHPFIAFTLDGSGFIDNLGLSNSSYAEAKENLLKKLTEKESRVKNEVPIPQPEEIEL